MFCHFINYGANTITVTFVPGSCSVAINNSAEADGTTNDALNAIRYFLVNNEQFLTENRVININLVANNRGKDTLQVSSDMREMQSQLRMLTSSYKCKFNINAGLNLIG